MTTQTTSRTTPQSAPQTVSRDPNPALAVLEQMFGYFSHDALPLEKPLHKPA